MILSEEKLCKEIKKYEDLKNKAYDNYQASGYSRYYSAYSRYEAMVDTLRIALTYKNDKVLLSRLKADISAWANRINKMPYLPKERKEDEITIILNEIMAIASGIENNLY